jgi:serine/threonine-protein kinase
MTAEEARAALDALPEYAPIATSFDTESIQDAVIGHTYVLAGRWAEALPFLQRAVANCDVFFAPLAHTRATLELGAVLETKGDERGACDAYSKVLARWGGAKPRSVTADKARARVKALACGR